MSIPTERQGRKITDHFKVGDHVKWIKVRHIGSTVEILHKVGTIRRIEGSTAMIQRPFHKRLFRVSLFELEVIREQSV